MIYTQRFTVFLDGWTGGGVFAFLVSFATAEKKKFKFWTL